MFNGGIPAAMNPTATPASPQASGLAVGAQAFGTTTEGYPAGAGPMTAAVCTVGGGVLALVILWCMWVNLPT